MPRLDCVSMACLECSGRIERGQSVIALMCGKAEDADFSGVVFHDQCAPRAVVAALDHDSAAERAKKAG